MALEEGEQTVVSFFRVVHLEKNKYLHILKSIFSHSANDEIWAYSSRPTSSVRHINKINHIRGLTHFEKMF